MPVEHRRFFVAIVGGLLAAPLAAETQHAAKVAKIGVLVPSTPAASAYLLEAFR